MQFCLLKKVNFNTLSFLKRYIIMSIFILELVSIKAFNKPDLLDKASQLFFHFNRLPRLRSRIECHQISFSWENNANLSSSQLGVIECACKELQRSQPQIQKILSLVLTIGNYLNGGTSRGQVLLEFYRRIYDFIHFLSSCFYL